MAGPRCLTNENDYQRVQRLLSENARNAGTGPYPTPGDLDFRRYLEGRPEDIMEIVLWEDEAERLLGFTWPSDDDALMVSLRGCSTIEEDMLLWNETHALEHGLATCSVYAYSRDASRIALLQEYGYVRTSTYCWYGRNVLTSTIPLLPAPEGFILRSIDTTVGVELEQRGLLHELAANRAVTSAQYARMTIEARQYRNSLDLVAAAPDGSLVAFSTGWYDEWSKRGLIEPYGSSPAFRRRGLGRALLMECLRRLQLLGAHDVVIAHGDCDSEEEDESLLLNRSVGFEPFGRDYLWQRSV